MKASPADEASRSTVTPISQPITPRKAAAKRHYGSHPYFTKRAWNVVQEYIRQFSDPDDLVLDPFGGSGITAVEALVLRRRAIHVDLAPLANLITWGIAVGPIDERAFQEAFADLRASCAAEVQALYELSDEVIATMDVPYWYPKDVRLPPDSDVPDLESLFHRRSLIGLSILLHHIKQITDEDMRNLYRLVFAATLNKTNLTFSSTTGRKDSRGDSAIFRVYRYWVPSRTIELNVWEQFELRQRGWLNAKRETNQVIGDYFRLGETIQIHQASATDLSNIVASESVDYIYTDPPYGAHIAYLDLMTMWNAWLELEVSEEDRELEIIEGGSLNKTRKSYVELLDESIAEMFRVLKYGRWLSIVFAHKDTAFWDAIVQSAQRVGFEYVNTAVQPSTTPSLHKRKNPLKVLSGELVLNFRKVSNPRTIAISALGSDVVQMIKNTAEVVIVRGDGASTEEVYNELIPVLLENGLLSEVRKKIPDITGLLNDAFNFSAPEGIWRIRENTKLGSFVPLDERIRFYLSDYLKRVGREGSRATFDDIIFNVMPNLINGIQPTAESILDVLNTIGYSPDGQHWQLRNESGSSGQLTWSFDGIAAIPLLPPSSEPEHDELIYRLAKLALAARVQPHIGKKEQASTVNGERLMDVGGGALPASLSKLDSWSQSKVEQIDCAYFDEAGRPLYAFEIETSTPITTGIDRFLELLKIEPGLAQRLVVVIPRARVRKLNGILRDSHYVGHPMYMENKIVWLFVEDLLQIYDKFAGKRAPSWTELRERLDQTVRHPKLG